MPLPTVGGAVTCAPAAAGVATPDGSGMVWSGTVLVPSDPHGAEFVVTISVDLDPGIHGASRRERELRRDGRAAEGAPLLREYGVNSSIEGSNPSLSAICRAQLTPGRSGLDNLRPTRP